MVKVKDVTIRGVELQIYADHHGVFHTDVGGKDVQQNMMNEDGNAISAESMKLLLEKADKRLKNRSKLNIRFVRWVQKERDWRESGKEPEYYLRKGTITGIHAGNGNVLVKWDGQKDIEQQHGWGHDNYLKMNDDQQELYVRLQRQKAELEQNIEAVEEKYKIDIQKEVGDLKTDRD